MKRPCYWCGSYRHHLTKAMPSDAACIAHVGNLLLDTMFGGGERGRYAKRCLLRATKRDAELVRKALRIPER